MDYLIRVHEGSAPHEQLHATQTGFLSHSRWYPKPRNPACPETLNLVEIPWNQWNQSISMSSYRGSNAQIIYLDDHSIPPMSLNGL